MPCVMQWQLLPAIIAMPATYCMHEGDACWQDSQRLIQTVLLHFCLLCRKTRTRLLKAVLTWLPRHQATLISPPGQPRL